MLSWFWLVSLLIMMDGCIGFCVSANKHSERYQLIPVRRTRTCRTERTSSPFFASKNENQHNFRMQRSHAKTLLG